MASPSVSAPRSWLKLLTLGGLSQAEQTLYWLALLSPLWWLLGLQVLLYPAVLIGLLVMAFDLDKLLKGSLPACAWAWLAMAAVMLWTGGLGLLDVGFGFKAVAAQAVTFFKSYCLIFACIALPFWTRLRVQVITRAVAWMATGYLVVIAIEMVMLVLGIGEQGYTPFLAKLIPGDKQSMQVLFANMSLFFGIMLPRTGLYTPDSPILGVAAVCCVLICQGEAQPQLRKLALAGSLLALILSFSRSAWISLPLALLISAAFGSSLARQVSLWGASLFSLLCAVFGLTPSQLIEAPLTIFTQARPDSSGDRELVVRKTLEAWQESPWLGWGIIRGAVRWHTYEVALGSFSTYASVLYLHGIVGFAVFLATLVVTLLDFWKPSRQGNPLARQAFGSLVALYLMCAATPLSWMAIYLWFYFVWLGAVLAETRQEPFSVRSWQELMAGGVPSSRHQQWSGGQW
ncbi:O-antigen ligase family protein [Leptolyngbya sp. FACHB-261]|nr:O-antigen ligase family protein [Leptolyngbya sp. FACHB-261]